MTRFVRSPAMSIAVFALWLLLVQSLSAGNVLLGVVLALFWPAATARFAESVPRARKPIVMASLFVRVVGDIVFFSCGQSDCGRPIRVTHESLTPTEVELACEAGHRYSVQLTDEGGLTLARRSA